MGNRELEIGPLRVKMLFYEKCKYSVNPLHFRVIPFTDSAGPQTSCLHLVRRTGCRLEACGPINRDIRMIVATGSPNTY